MKRFSVRLPDDVVKIIDGYVKDGEVPSRSEAIRYALDDFFHKSLSEKSQKQKGYKEHS